MFTTALKNQNLTKRTAKLTNPTEVGRLDRYRYLLNKYSSLADQINEFVSAQIDFFDIFQPELLLRLADYNHWVNIILQTLQTYQNRAYVLKNKELSKTVMEISFKLNKIKRYISSNSEQITNNLKVALGIASDDFSEMSGDDSFEFPKFRNVRYVKDTDKY